MRSLEVKKLKKKNNQDLLRTKVTLEADLPASSTIDFSSLEAFCQPAKTTQNNLYVKH